MSNTNANFEMNGILLGQEVRKRQTPQEKIAIIQQTMEPGMNVSTSPACTVFSPACCSSGRSSTRKAASPPLLPEKKSCLPLNLTAALKQVRELQRLLGKKTMEVEILKEAVEYGQSRKWIAHAPLLPKDGE